MPDKPTVVCFGEILWDVLPNASLPGGAPMNVAYHLKKMGIDSNMISRVGNDEKGEKLIALLQSWGISTENCQVDTSFKTSEVIATEGLNHEMSYEILHPVAWDFIEYNDKVESLVKKADALVFGSLITRNIESAKTLQSLIDIANYKVFDINLRAPHYSTTLIKEFLQKADLLKLNEHELTEVGKWYDTTVDTAEAAIRMLQEEFGIHEIIITNGSKGSTYITPRQTITQQAYPVRVADTIGSGDSFLAGFLSKKLQGASPETALSYAASLASFVTQNHGACPDYNLQTLEQFRSSHGIV